jgi:prevent-host-death family protein
MSDVRDLPKMRSMAALEAKNRFGELLDAAQREPVSIEKHGRPVAVVVSAEDYKELEALKLAKLKAEIELGRGDLKAGRTEDGRKAIKAVRNKLK